MCHSSTPSSCGAPETTVVLMTCYDQDTKGEEDDMLECYKCCQGYHLTCLDPPLTDPPQVLLAHVHGLFRECLPHWPCKSAISL